MLLALIATLYHINTLPRILQKLIMVVPFLSPILAPITFTLFSMIYMIPKLLLCRTLKCASRRFKMVSKLLLLFGLSRIVASANKLTSTAAAAVADGKTLSVVYAPVVATAINNPPAKTHPQDTD